MIRALLAAALAGAPTAVAQNGATPSPTPQPTCEVDRTAMLRLSPHDFDQNETKGWRPLSAHPECRLAAADLIREYRNANWGKLLPHEAHINYWHEGQLRASAGETEAAIPLLLAGVNPASIDGFPHYAMATVAFLQRDLSALKQARARLAALPVPQWFDEMKRNAPAARKMKWPLNLDVVDGLIRCFHKPYSEAYGHPDCR